MSGSEPSAGPSPEPDGYAAAMAELEAILRGLEDEDLDVDVLAERVARAAELIGWCRARVAGVRMQVDRVVAELDDDQSTA